MIVDPTRCRTLVGTLLLMVIGVWIGTGCEDTEAPVKPEISVPTSIVVSPSSAMLRAFGETVRLTVAVHDQNGQVMTGVAVFWTSDNASVASVDSLGRVTSTGNGEAVISAIVGTVEGSAKIVVLQQVTEVGLSPATAILTAIGDTVRHSAEATDANGHVVAGMVFSWSSDVESIAAVDASGLTTSVGNGSVRITASADGVLGTAGVTVKQQVAAVSVTPATITLSALEESARLFSEARDANGHLVQGAHITWSSDDVSVAVVDATGVLTAAGNGTTNITAAIDSVRGSAEVTVEQRATAVDVSPTEDTLFALGDTVRLAAAARDANGHAVLGAQFTWSTDDMSIVTVDQSGLATATGHGGASITASVDSVPGSTAITVDQRVAAVAVSPPGLAFSAVGDTARFLAAAVDANGHAVPHALFVWSSDNETVITVDQFGLVTAQRNGTGIIGASAEGKEARATVSVEQRVAEVRVTPATMTLFAIGDTARIVAESRDANGHPVSGDPLWSSSDDSVALVDSTGLVIATANGSAVVTASVGAVEGRTAVTVEQRVTVVTVLPTLTTFTALGDTASLAAEGRDANGNPVGGAQPLWFSSDRTVATITEQGLVTTTGNGKADIVALVHTIPGSAEVSVQQRVAGVRVYPLQSTLHAYGDTLRLLPEAVDANGHTVPDAAFQWLSTNAFIATVDMSGLVTALGEGKVSIWASTGDHHGRATITVTRRPAEVIVWPRTRTMVEIGQSVHLFAKAVDPQGQETDAAFTWSSTDESVASVDTSGLVTARGNGRTLVIASTESLRDSAIITVDDQLPFVGLLAPAKTEPDAKLDVFLHLQPRRLGHTVGALAVTISYDSTKVSLAKDSPTSEYLLVHAPGTGHLRLVVSDPFGLRAPSRLLTVPFVATKPGIATFDVTVTQIIDNQFKDISRKLATRGTHTRIIP